MRKTIRVLVVDDSPFICRLLTSYLNSAPDMQVVGQVVDGNKVLASVKELKPDAITLDLGLANAEGLVVLADIMCQYPTPIIVVSGVSKQGANITLQALDLGAVDFIFKYTPQVNRDPEELRNEIIAKVRAASQIRVVRSLVKHPSPEALPLLSSSKAATKQPMFPQELANEVVVIGASTGGPMALRVLLGNLPANFSAGLIVVQHIPESFIPVLVKQLNLHTLLQVKEAEEGESLKPGVILVAPGDYHLTISNDCRVKLNQSPKVGGFRPAIDVTMQSVAKVYGARTKGVILTGMGEDGAKGMAYIHAQRGKTYAQDAESCVVNGMPQRAIELGQVDHVAPPDQLAQLLIRDQQNR